MTTRFASCFRTWRWLARSRRQLVRSDNCATQSHPTPPSPRPHPARLNHSATTGLSDIRRVRPEVSACTPTPHGRSVPPSITDLVAIPTVTMPSMNEFGATAVSATGRGQHDRGRTPLPKNFPPVVYLPVLAPVQRVEDAQIMLRQTRDGRVACLAYSALDRLLTCCGEDQPWMWTPTVALDALQRVRPFDLLLLDVYIPEENRRQSRA